MKVVVTGGAGFIGSHTVELLVSKGYDVIVIDDFSSGSLKNLSNVVEKISVVNRSILDKEALDTILRDADAIIHLAAIVSVEESIKDPERVYRVNALGTLYLLEASRRHDIERFVYASSAAVYGDPIELPVKEVHPCRPKNVYGSSKLAGETLVYSYKETYGLSTISLRYFNVYGPRMKPGDYAGVVYKFFERILQGKPPIIHGDGEQTRDFVYVGDVARANVIALSSRETGVYNIGTGKAISINELAEKIMGIVGVKLEPAHGPPRPGDIRYSVADITQAIEKLGWKPTVSIEEGLRKTLDYMKYMVSKKWLS